MEALPPQILMPLQPQSPPAQQQPNPLAQQPIPLSDNSTPSSTGSGNPNVTSTSNTQSILTIPVPICPPEDIYTYVAVKGSLHDTNASIFGLNREEKLALAKRFPNGQTEIVNAIMVKGSPIDVVNCLSKLGYKVICSTGEAEIVWTMQREI